MKFKSKLVLLFIFSIYLVSSVVYSVIPQKDFDCNLQSYSDGDKWQCLQVAKALSHEMCEVLDDPTLKNNPGIARYLIDDLSSEEKLKIESIQNLIPNLFSSKKCLDIKSSLSIHPSECPTDECLSIHFGFQGKCDQIKTIIPYPKSSIDLCHEYQKVFEGEEECKNINKIKQYECVGLRKGLREGVHSSVIRKIVQINNNQNNSQSCSNSTLFKSFELSKKSENSNEAKSSEKNISYGEFSLCLENEPEKLDKAMTILKYWKLHRDSLENSFNNSAKNRSILKDNEKMINYFLELKNDEILLPENLLLLCDQKGIVRSMALLEKHNLRINSLPYIPLSYLISSPFNFQLDGNIPSFQIKGAGVHMIKEVIKISRARGNSGRIYLHQVLDSARDFYLKLGFIDIIIKDKSRMILNEEEADKLFPDFNNQKSKKIKLY